MSLDVQGREEAGCREGGSDEPSLEFTLVMPCLNESDTLETCIRKAQGALRRLGIRGEIVVADNGSTDGSPEIAERCGARLIRVAERGYGSALMAGGAPGRGGR